MKRNFLKRRTQHGVALLFALGILSLLLILGLAFVTNAVIARKVAFNNSSRAQAKMLAQSAISRVAISTMMYQYIAQNPPAGKTQFWPEEFTGVYSYDKNNGKEYDDQLKYTDDVAGKKFSKLNYPENTLGYEGYKSNAKWAFIYDKSSSSTVGEQQNQNPKIIGRIAYQVLPPTSNSRINLSNALEASANRPNLTTQKRLGVDIGELNIEYAKAFEDQQSPQTMLNNLLTAGDVPVYYDDLYTAYKNNFFQESNSDTESNKDWIERWFNEGPNRVDFEAFLYEENGKKNYAYRFNLGEDNRFAANDATADDWYARFYTNFDVFKTAVQNDETAINRLTQDAVDFKEMGRHVPNNSGLPFLRLIGDSQGSFGSLATRRKQIAANFNDYCDKDSIPTSDVNAKNWDNPIALVSLPSFTGNEKTPYINELGWGIKLKPSYVDATGVLTTTVTPEFLAEIIDIYGGAAQTYTLHTNLKELQLKMKVSLAGDITYKRINTSTNMQEGTKIVPVTVSIATPAEFLYQPAAPTYHKIDIDFNDPVRTFKDGYALGNKEIILTDKTITTQCLSTLQTTPPPTESGYKFEFDTAAIEGVQYIITDFAFKLGPVSLFYDNSDTTLATGVDFVNWPDHLISITGKDFKPFEKNARLFTRTDAPAVAQTDGFLPLTSEYTSTELTGNQNSYRFYIGGFETVDPRQNLNIKSPSGNIWSSDPRETDWIINPEFTSFKNDPEVLSMTIKENPTDQQRLEAGKKNFVTDAATPDTSYFLSGEYDKESNADPADGRLSTAFIRNEPMESPWEIGLIHRGAAWETINLKNAESPSSSGNPIKLEDHAPLGNNNWGVSGTSYKGGDGGILDQIKMTKESRSYGKLDLNMLWNNEDKNPGYMEEYDSDWVKALFANLKYGQQLLNFTDSGATTRISDSDITGKPDQSTTIIGKFMEDNSSRPFTSRAQFLHWKNSEDYLGNAFGIIPRGTFDGWSDAQQEEIIGKTINLLTASNGALPNVIQVLIVAQTIRDIGGDGSDIQITKLKSNGDPVPHNCRLGQFDIEEDDKAPDTSPDRHVYFDEITGEVKIIVTIDRNPLTGRMMVRKMDYIE